MPKRRLLVFADHCRHSWIDRVAGPMERRCDLGYDVRDLVGGPNFGWNGRQPCTGGKLASPDNAMVPCSDYSPPTPAEFVRDTNESARQMDRILAGWCPGCDVALVTCGNVSACPNNCGTSVRRCGSNDMEHN